jgi:hypothetical protein
MSMDFSVFDKVAPVKNKALSKDAPMGRLFASIATLKDSPRQIGAYDMAEQTAPDYLHKYR